MWHPNFGLSKQRLGGPPAVVRPQVHQIEGSAASSTASSCPRMTVAQSPALPLERELTTAGGLTPFKGCVICGALAICSGETPSLLNVLALRAALVNRTFPAMARTRLRHNSATCVILKQPQCWMLI